MRSCDACAASLKPVVKWWELQGGWVESGKRVCDESTSCDTEFRDWREF